MANPYSFFGKSARKLILTPDHFTGASSGYKIHTLGRITFEGEN
jgi:hypothetical protein